MRILIADDEPLARTRLRAQIAELGMGTLVGEARNGFEAVQLTSELRPDIVVLDIRMPGMDGLEAARHLAGLPDPPAVIFTTAFDQHALAAFDAHAIDYVLKPVRGERLRQALERAAAFGNRPAVAQLHNLPGGEQARTHISAPYKGQLRLVPVDAVRFLCADQRYVRVGWPDGELLVEESLRSLEDEFSDRFLRVHRKTLVARAYVRSLARDTDGNHTIGLDGVDARFVVSRRLMSNVRRQLLVPTGTRNP